MLFNGKYIVRVIITQNWRSVNQREGFVLDFCPTFQILSFVTSCKNLRSPTAFDLKRGVFAFSEDSRALRLTSELVDLRAANANPLLLCFAKQKVFIIEPLSPPTQKAHLAVCFALAEREGFEPSCACAQTDFESSGFNPF